MKDVPRLEFAFRLDLNQMYEDVPSSIMLDKTILNELEIENVIPLFLKKNSKAIFLGGFFFY